MPIVQPNRDETGDAILQGGALQGRVIMMVPPRVSYTQELQGIAKGLIERGQHSVAVVVCHIACAVAGERAQRRLRCEGLAYLAPAVDDLLNGYNLANEKTRNLFNALTGNAIQNDPFWVQFKASAKRRNKAVHEGLIVSQQEAEASLQAAKDLIAHLKQ